MGDCEAGSCRGELLELDTKTILWQEVPEVVSKGNISPISVEAGCRIVVVSKAGGLVVRVRFPAA